METFAWKLRASGSCESDSDANRLKMFEAASFSCLAVNGMPYRSCVEQKNNANASGRDSQRDHLGARPWDSDRTVAVIRAGARHFTAHSLSPVLLTARPHLGFSLAFPEERVALGAGPGCTPDAPPHPRTTASNSTEIEIATGRVSHASRSGRSSNPRAGRIAWALLPKEITARPLALPSTKPSAIHTFCERLPEVL